MQRVLLRLLGAVLVTVAVAGCAPPSYTYVTNADDHVFFKVPASWKRIDQNRLDALATTGLTKSEAAVLRASSWRIAFDAAPRPSVDHVFANVAPLPVVYSRVVRVPEETRAGVTVESLRNAFVPLTAPARLQAAAQGRPVPVPDVVTDEVVTRPGLQGVHMVFRVTLDGSVETFDQTAYKSRDGSRIFMLLVRCAQTCYQARHDEVVSTVRSFTVERIP